MSDKNLRDYILDLISGIIVLSLFTYIVVKYRNKTWKCIEGTCEKVIIGDYSSSKECKKHCSPQEQKQLKTYSCDTSKNQCIEVTGPDGQFNKLIDCQNNCKQPVVTTYTDQYYFPYYPQSLMIPIYPNRRRFRF